MSDINKSFETLGVTTSKEEVTKGHDPYGDISYMEKSIIDFLGNKRVVGVAIGIQKSEITSEMCEQLENIKKAEEDGDFEKSDITRALSRGVGDKSDNSLIVEKIGSEIKTGISVLQSLLVAKINSCKSKSGIAKNQAGSEPVEEYDADDWMFEGVYHRMEDIPKRYSYKQQYPESYHDDGVKSVAEYGQPDNSVATVTKEQRQAMNDYNRESRKIIGYQAEHIKLGTIANAMNDKKSYKLSIDQAAVLGF